MVNPLAPDDPRRVGPFTLEGRLGGALNYVGRRPGGAAAAVRVATPEPAADPEFRRRFARAVTALGRIRDPHVAALVGADAMATHPWLATEYADGPSLRAVVAERGALPVPEIRRLVADLAGALAAIHEVGLAHHDLTADTVLLPPEGARLVGLAAGGPVDPRADVAALGALIVHLATGRPDAPVDEVPEPLHALVRRCLADGDRATPAEVRAAAHSPLDYVGTDPPADPLDLSAGVAVPVVGPLTALADEPDEDPLAYPAAAPPENPLDLSAGIPSDAVVGPIPAQAGPDPPEAITYAGTAPPANPLDLSTGLPAEAVVEPALEEAGEEAGGPTVVDTITTPPRHRSRRRRRLTSVIAAVVLVASAVVLLVRDRSTAGTPIAAPGTPVLETSAGGPTCTGAKRLAGSGSALQHDAMLAIADQWAAHCVGSTLDYVPVGTSTGLQQFATGETDLAVTDHPLGAGQVDQANPGEIAAAAARCAGVGAPANKDLVVQVPAVLTPIVLTYHVTGVAELRLDAPAVTAIFSGKVTRWNDPVIAELNPGTRLPAVVITVIARAGQAVSTQTFQQFLTVAGGWTSGDGPEFTGTTTASQRTDADVRAAVRAVEGAIGYLPLPATRSTDEPVVSLVTGGGTAAEPDAASVNAAVDDAVDGVIDTAPGGPDDFTRLPGAILRAGTDETHPTDQVGDGPAPYPLVHVGYVVACTQYPGKGTAPAVRDFLLTGLGMQVESARGYQLPLGDLRLRLVDLVQRTY